MAEFSTDDLITAALLNQKTIYIGTGAPSTVYDGQLWVDTSENPPLLKIYDATNTMWLELRPIWYETQSGSWADPSTSPVIDGTLAIVYNSTQGATRLYARANNNWYNIFGAASVENPTFERYYDGTLANNADYTPSDEGLYCAASTSNDDTRDRFYTGSDWVTNSRKTASNTSHHAVLSDGTNYSLHNSSGSVTEVVLMRADLRNSDPVYERYATGTLASGATYAPAVSGLFNLAVGGTGTNWGKIRFYSTSDASWKNHSIFDDTYEFGEGVVPSDGNNVEIKNQDSITHNYVMMRWH